MARVALIGAGVAVGAVLGSVIPGVGPLLGAQLGAAAGGLLGAVLFPIDGPTIEGARLNDLKIQGSSYGAAIPWVWSRFRLAGNVIWATDLVEVRESEEVGGKGGGGSTQVDYSYFANFAVLLCRAPATVSKIWANGKLIYKASKAQPYKYEKGSDLNIYTGTETQEADPFIQADQGITNTPAFRGNCYIVFNKLPLADFGNRIPNIEVLLNGEGEDYNFEYFKPEDDTGETTILTEYYEDTWTPTFDYLYRVGRIGASSTDQRLFRLNISTETWESFDITNADVGGSPTSGSLSWAGMVVDSNRDIWIVNSVGGSFEIYKVTPAAHKIAAFTTVTGPSSFVEAFDIGDHIALFFTTQVSFLNKTSVTVTETVSFSGLPTTYNATVDAGGNGWMFATDAFGGNPTPVVLFKVTPPGSTGTRLTNETPWAAAGTFAHSSQFIEFDPLLNGLLMKAHDGVTGWATRYFDIATLTEQWSLGPSPDSKFSWFVYGGTRDGFAWLSGLEYATDAVAGDLVFRKIDLSDGAILQTLRRADGIPAFSTVDADGYVEPFFYNPDDARVFYNHGRESTASPSPNGMLKWTFGFAGSTLAMLQEIVGDICTAVGIAGGERDTLALGDRHVKGYALTRQMSGVAALAPLRQAYFMHAVESGSVLKFGYRGRGPVATIEKNELGERGQGQGLVPRLGQSRTDDIDLPLRITVAHIDPSFDYQVLTQKDERNSSAVASIRKVDIELPLQFSATDAKKIAQRQLYLAWIGRWSYQWATSRRWLELDPGDVVRINDGTRIHEVYITKISFGADNVLAFDGISEDEAAHVTASTITGAEVAGFTEQTAPTTGQTTLVLGDWPLLRDVDDAPGIYAAGEGDANWTSGIVYQSSDQVNYARVFSLTKAALIGAATTKLPDGRTDIVDKVSEVTVDIGTGTLESTTELLMLNGTNRAMVGAELIGFTTVSTVASGVYRLSGLLRGLQGSEWATGQHATGENFTLLNADGSILDVAGSLSDIGLERFYKAVTTGLALEDAGAQSFTPTGVRLRPVAPSHLTGIRRSGNDLEINWIGGTRAGSDWLDEVEEPVDEAVETYEVDIIGVTSTTVSVTNPGSETSLTGWTQEQGSWTSLTAFNTLSPFEGARSFYGQGTAAEADNRLVQTVAIPTAIVAATIANGYVTAIFRATQGQDLTLDAGDIQMEFLDVASARVESVVKAGLLVTSTSTWTARTISEVVPTSTTQIKLIMRAFRFDGINCNIAFDALTLNLEAYATTVRTITTNVASTTYTSAQQVTDFGSTRARVLTRVFQISSRVGRGYERKEVL